MAGMQPEGNHVMFPAEAEAYIQDLKTMGVANIASENICVTKDFVPIHYGTSTVEAFQLKKGFNDSIKKMWTAQREKIDKLMVQAIANATEQSDDFVTNLLVSYDKVKVLIHELICLDVWKRNVFPLLFEQPIVPTSGFPAYLILYHEASVLSLLETVLFYRESCEGLDEIILDLVDYCYRKITELVCRDIDDVKEEVNTGEKAEGIYEELACQERTISFGVEMKCLSIVHYISDHLKVLPLSVSTRLLNTYDFPCLLVSILEKAPWSKTSSKTGKLMRYENGKWNEIEVQDRLKVTKLQAQVWLTFYRLLMDSESQGRYEFTSQKKQCLLKLQGYLTDPLLEQIPILEDLKRYLQHLSLTDPPPARTVLILEQVPIIYDKLIQEWKGKWAELARKWCKQLLAPDPAKLKADATRWIESYNFDALESLTDGPPRCAQCGREATKRCSRCRMEWYCGRECQVKQWKKHKGSCDLLKEALDSGQR